jgi:hypothetical protein
VTVKTALRELNNAVLDLQSADYNTFERPLERLSSVLTGPDLKEITDRLREIADFDKFLEGASGGGGMMGSARLNWPANRKEEFGLVIELIERGAKDPRWFINLAHTYYYSGRKIVGDIRKITTAVVIPFNRDFANYVNDLVPEPKEQDVNGSSPGVTYNIGAMHNSPLQHVSPGAHGTQTTNYSSDDLRSIVALYQQHVDELGLDDAQRRRADAQVATIEAQLIDEPDPSIIKAAGKSLRTIVEGAIGGAAGTAIAAAPVWAPLIWTFGG